jgi:hypothetical protein
MLVSVERRWKSLCFLITARNAVKELRAADEGRILENFLDSRAWGQLLEFSRTKKISISGSSRSESRLYLQNGTLFHDAWEGRGSCRTTVLDARNFYAEVAPGIYGGSAATVLRKFIGDVDHALLRLAAEKT